MEETYTFRAITEAKLDPQLIRALRMLATATTVEAILNAADSGSPKEPFFRAILDAACSQYDNVPEVLQAIDDLLIAFFVDTAPRLPREVEELTFLMHYAVHGPAWRVTGGVTLLDAYFDLTVADLQLFDTNDHASMFAHWIPEAVTGSQAIVGWANLSEEEFYTVKWKLLREVLSIQGNEVCNAPGVQILDDILESLDGDANQILGKKNNFENYFEEGKNTPPASILVLLDHLTQAPITPDQYQDVVNNLPIETDQDSLIIEVLSRLEGYLIEKFEKAVEDFRTHVRTELETEDAGYVEDVVTTCQGYIFTDVLCDVLKTFYPHYGINGIADWFMNTEAADWFLQVLDSPEKVKKGKKTLDVYFTPERIRNAGPVGYALVYLLKYIGKPKRRIGTLDGTSKGLVRQKDKRTALTGRLIQLAGFTPPKPKKAVDVIEAQASSIQILLLRHYRFQALNHLMYREVHFLDPIIGDTLCELRPAFLMDCDIIIQGALVNQAGWQGLVSAYNGVRQDCPLAEDDVPSPLSLLGTGPEPFNYILLCRHLEDALRNDGEVYFPRFLTLCKAMTRVTMLVRDTLGTEMGENHASFMGSKERSRRRVEMGTYNIWYTKSRMNDLRSIEINNTPLSTSCTLLNTTADVLNNCYALHQDGEIPVVPLYQAQLFTMLKAFVLNRPIIVRLKRIHILDQRDDRSFNVGADTPETHTNFTYQTVDSDVLVFTPNQNTGGFDFVDDADHLLDVPCMTISAYGLLDLTDRDSWETDPGRENGAVGEEFYNEDASAYINFVKGLSVINLLNVCSANHPPFAPNPRTIVTESINAENAFLGQFSGIDSFEAEHTFWRNLINVRSNNTAIDDQFVYLAGLYDEDEGNLAGASTIHFGEAYTLFTNPAFTDFAEFYRLGEETDLGARQFKDQTILEQTPRGQITVYKRRRGNMPFYSTHIYCSTLRIELARNEPEGRGFYLADLTDSFATKDEVVDFTFNYLQIELENARSMQSEQND